MSDDIKPPDISPEFRAYIESITAKRPKTVLTHILEHGYITTDELNQLYHYKHPPRAARDVREYGIQLKTFRVNSADGRSIGAYMLTDNAFVGVERKGRRAFPKKFKNTLLARDGEQCAMCNGRFPGRILQIDHKVPYEVAGDSDDTLNPEEFMLLCNSCNRAKSWTCEHCDNWLNGKSPAICHNCLFGSPDNYEHIAMRQRRRLTLTWEEAEIYFYDLLKVEANESGQTMAEYIKNILKSKSGLR
jgi:5-methylcytosine-specific restriction endonuclease McrA